MGVRCFFSVCSGWLLPVGFGGDFLRAVFLPFFRWPFPVFWLVVFGLLGVFGLVGFFWLVSFDWSVLSGQLFLVGGAPLAGGIFMYPSMYVCTYVYIYTGALVQLRPKFFAIRSYIENYTPCVVGIFWTARCVFVATKTCNILFNSLLHSSKTQKKVYSTRIPPSRSRVGVRVTNRKMRLREQSFRAAVSGGRA